MKLNLLTKYIILYIVIAVLSFVGISLICYRIDYNKIENEYQNELYRQTTAISYKYASVDFTPQYLSAAENDLQSIASVTGTRILFITSNGEVLLDTKHYGSPDEKGVRYTLADFDSSVFDKKHSYTSNFFGLYDKNNLNVLSPITTAFRLKCYVVISMPEETITQKVYLTFNTNYVSMAFILFLTLGYILLYILQIHKPLKEIIKGTEEYGKGNLEYHIKKMHNDEIGQLALSLNIMSSELNEMDQFQQKFLSNISHDFRSPLTSIKGYLEAISDGTIPPEQINKYIHIVLFETERLTKLTSNILTLNELDPKSVRLDLSIFDINSIIKHTIETFEGKCMAQNIQFQLVFSGKKAYVRADKSKIQQVIYNLIDNAIKFSKPNSYIYITVREKGEKIYTTVKDTGTGISKENLEKIWDRFYKSDSSRGKDKKGSGLGLSITKEIIQAHNEHIDVISTIDVGSEFTFTLPLVKNEST